MVDVRGDKNTTAEELQAIAKAFDGSRNREVDPEPGFVIYAGPATRRVITPENWKKEDIEDVGASVWDRRNKYKLPLGDFDERQIAVLRRDPSFVIGEQSEDGTEEPDPLGDD